MYVKHVLLSYKMYSLISFGTYIIQMKGKRHLLSVVYKTKMINVSVFKYENVLLRRVLCILGKIELADNLN